MSYSYWALVVASLTLVATLVSILISYLNFRSQNYISIGERQTDLQMFDSLTIDTLTPTDQIVQENLDQFDSDFLEMRVKNPQVSRGGRNPNWKERIREKYFPTNPRKRSTEVQVEFSSSIVDFPNLYDLCIYSHYEPYPYTGQFSSVVGSKHSTIGTVIPLSETTFTVRIVTDNPSEVRNALDAFYKSVHRVIVYRKLIEQGRMHPRVQKSIASDLEEMIEEYESMEDSPSMLTAPPLPDETFETFRSHLEMISR